MILSDNTRPGFSSYRWTLICCEQPRSPQEGSSLSHIHVPTSGPILPLSNRFHLLRVYFFLIPTEDPCPTFPPILPTSPTSIWLLEPISRTHIQSWLTESGRSLGIPGDLSRTSN
ncbi:hypothetical protein RRG08_020129 [Elysia crispata]|uniref:Uncharacterized protein n=1 Tax=Elysia crispata TaxID=231223 RepID=A0AAE1A4T8_9GAST|nr:hypothetical protein RRG08_020129 [Elysia crispata]